MKKLIIFIVAIMLTGFSINNVLAEETEKQDETTIQENIEIIDGTTITSQPFEADKNN